MRPHPGRVHRIGYDNAQVCMNGHFITQFADTRPQGLKNFCDKCGAPTTRICPKCSKRIQGFNHTSAIARKQPASFCHECGAPFPWTEQSLARAQQFAEEEANFNAEEREQLQQSLSEMVKQTNNPLAVSRFKRLMTKGGKVVSDGLHDILVDVLSEAVKKTIWPT